MLRAVSGSASVLLHGREVGELRFATGGSVFRYSDDLLDPAHRVLGETFEEEPRRLYRAAVGLPAWFANLLPEQGSGLRRFYAGLFHERRLDDARLLLALGDDLPGAVTVVPIDVPAEGVLVDSVAARVDESGVHLSALAGAQPKMSVQRDGERLTVPARGETGHWIVKFGSGAYPSLPENEYLMMSWAKAAGLDVPATDLVAAASVPSIFENVRTDRHAYLVERFDRTAGSGRVHIEDLAQVTDTPPELRAHDATYDGIGLLVQRLTGDTGFEDYVRRLVAMVVMGNCDAHLKNWSLHYPDGRTANLSPVYDLVCTTVYPTLDRKLVFPLAGRTRPDQVDAGAMAVLAHTVGFSPERVGVIVGETADRLRAAWRAVRREPLFPDLVEHIDGRLARHPLTRA